MAYAKVFPVRGSWCHDGQVIYDKHPTEKGYWTRFKTVRSQTAYAGPFETEKEARKAGNNSSDFRGIILVD